MTKADCIAALRGADRAGYTRISGDNCVFKSGPLGVSPADAPCATALGVCLDEAFRRGELPNHAWAQDEITGGFDVKTLSGDYTKGEDLAALGLTPGGCAMVGTLNDLFDLRFDEIANLLEAANTVGEALNLLRAQLLERVNIIDGMLPCWGQDCLSGSTGC